MPDEEQFEKLHSYKELVRAHVCLPRRLRALARAGFKSAIQAPFSSEFPTLESSAELGTPPWQLPAAPARWQLKRGPDIIYDKRLDFFS